MALPLLIQVWGCVARRSELKVANCRFASLIRVGVKMAKLIKNGLLSSCWGCKL